ncbi:unnamed protein product [Cylicocyclus nassatus]|uniref:Uncharacterized protein n=1 Tax=Cylicocyclus nassatus TaxID=53992 RepID=A0AA36M1J7_CYLNA|nr:unnamed protein product [Cylicocyclus nassatus]
MKSTFVVIFLLWSVVSSARNLCEDYLKNKWMATRKCVQHCRNDERCGAGNCILHDGVYACRCLACY